MRVDGIEPSTSVLRAPYKICDSSVRADGIEPSTSVLSGQRSTTELCSQIFIRGQDPVVEINFTTRHGSVLPSRRLSRLPDFHVGAELHAQILLRNASNICDIIYFFQKLHAGVFFNQIVRCRRVIYFYRAFRFFRYLNVFQIFQINSY